MSDISDHFFNPYAGKFPKHLKYAKLLPLHKSASKCNLINYHPISLLLSCSSVRKFSQMNNYFEKLNLLYCKQFDCRQNYATIDALAKFTENLRFRTENGLICGFFVVLRKTFNTEP